MSQITSARKVPSADELRGFARFPCSQAAFCCTQKPRDYIFWTARARNISVGGVRLIVGHHFDPGTMLAVELLCANQSMGRELSARVIYATARGRGIWTIGCEFVKRLSEAELVALL